MMRCGLIMIAEGGCSVLSQDIEIYRHVESAKETENLGNILPLDHMSTNDQYHKCVRRLLLPVTNPINCSGRDLVYLLES